MANSKKRCKQCKKYFPAESMKTFPVGTFCTTECAMIFAKDKGNQKRAHERARKEERKELRKAKERLKTRSQWLGEAQEAFNRYIRLRDRDDLCISCDRTLEQIEGSDGWKPGGAWDCGHYKTRGAFPELRFEELNAHKQCKSCNGGSGKYSKKDREVIERYRKKLIKKIGVEKVEWLEGPHKPKKYTIEGLKDIKAYYMAKCKELKRQ